MPRKTAMLCVYKRPGIFANTVEVPAHARRKQCPINLVWDSVCKVLQFVSTKYHKNKAAKPSKSKDDKDKIVALS